MPTAPSDPQTDLGGAFVEAAQNLFSRLLDKYLPPRERGYVGDDRPSEQLSTPSVPLAEQHRVLGLRPDATVAEIKRRVRQLAKVFHPDLDGGDADKMAEINDAARALLDARARPNR